MSTDGVASSQRGRGPTATERWVILGAVVGALVLRVAWAVWATRDPQGANDPTIYAGLAERFADGRGYVGPTGAPTAYFPPGYPMALGTVLWLAQKVGIDGHLPGIAAGFNVVLGTATVALLAILAGRLFGWRVASVAAVLLALFPSLIGYSSVVLSEPLFLFLVAVALLCVLWEPLTAPATGWARLVGGSLALGAALLVRPVGGLVVVALLVGFVLAGGGRVVLARSAVVVGVVALALVPWMVRNATSLDTGLTLSTNTGDNLCIGNNPDANGGFGTPDYCFADLPDQDGPADVAEVARAETTQERALEWIRENPGAQPRLVLLRLAATFQNGHEFRWASESYGADPWYDESTLLLVDWIADLGWWTVIVLGACGAPLLWSRADPRRIVVLGAIVGLAVVTWPFFGNARFGVPAVALAALPAAVVLAGLPALWTRARAAGAAAVGDPR